MVKEPISIVTWLWGDKYTNTHVNVLYRAIKANYSKPFKFFCITDRVDSENCYYDSKTFDYGVNVVPIWPDFMHLGQQYRRLKLLDGTLFSLGDKLLQLDLEMIILKDFTHLITNEPFKIWKCPSTGPKGFMYNTSLMMFNRGFLHGVYEKFRANPTKEIMLKQKNQWMGTDQAVISNYVHPAECWTHLDGVYSYKIHIEKPGLLAPPDDAVIVGLYGREYDQVKKLDVPWIRDYWDKYKTKPA